MTSLGGRPGPRGSTMESPPRPGALIAARVRLPPRRTRRKPVLAGVDIGQ
jgi:hypothetical protein